ncbi:ABC transporter permease [Ferrimonas kyonanensis]|uniref:ABC transporter permease n=1 Tax=Ferrimonas kyonanensis TaxID=364763 RepID=UPI0003FCBE55|nr:ABC transporter permease [Ferrimonas kyonanensis]
MAGVIDIAWWQLLLFLSILLVPAWINRHFRLSMGREGAWAVMRMVAQLVLVGLYLQFLFDLDSLALNLLWLLAMVLIGASSVVSKTHLPRSLALMPVILGLGLALVPVLFVMVLGLVRPEPFYNAQYLIPMAGMLLGNSLSGNIMALQRFVTALGERQGEYQGALVLGATPAQAVQPFLQSALSQSMAPLLATISTTGLVSLPGMMTGQILGGTDPMVAIKYQIVIMVAILVMVSVSAAVSLLLASRRLLCSNGRVRIPLNAPQ